MKKYNAYLLVFLSLFFVLAFGSYRALHKPLWNDELFSWWRSIEASSYKEILIRPILINPTEGNNSPVYYLLHKAVLDVLGVRRKAIEEAGLERGLEPAAMAKMDNKLLVSTIAQPPRGMDNVSYDHWPMGLVVHRLVSIVSVAIAVIWLAFYLAKSFSMLASIFLLLMLFTSHLFESYLAEARPYALWMALIIIHMAERLW